jgi:hypothetical protein
MIASGWQTATPQVSDIEVVMVTNSACRQLLEGSFGISNLYRPTYSAAERARWYRSVYASSERTSDNRRFEFRRLFYPVRTAVSHT